MILQTNKNVEKYLCVWRFKDLLMKYFYLQFTRIMRCCCKILISWFSLFVLDFIFSWFISIKSWFYNLCWCIFNINGKKNVTFCNFCYDNSCIKTTQCERFKWSFIIFFSISIKKVTIALLIWFASARFTIAIKKHMVYCNCLEFSGNSFQITRTRFCS